MRSNWARLGALLLCLSPSATAFGQARLNWVGDIGVAFGVGHGGVYRNRDLGEKYASGTLRIRSTRRMAVSLGLLASGSIVNGETADCRDSPIGGCLRDYPKVGGAAAVIGVVLTPINAMEWHVGVGVGALRSDDVRSAHTIGQTDLAFFAGPHVGGVFGVRGTIATDYRGARLRRMLFSLGVRLRYGA